MDGAQKKAKAGKYREMICLNKLIGLDCLRSLQVKW